MLTQHKFDFTTMSSVRPIIVLVTSCWNSSVQQDCELLEHTLTSLGVGNLLTTWFNDALWKNGSCFNLTKYPMSGRVLEQQSHVLWYLEPAGGRTCP